MKQRLYLLLLAFLTPVFAFCQDPDVKGIDQIIDEGFAPISKIIQKIIFFAIPLGGDLSIPVVLIVLLLGATIFTIYFKFPNIRFLPLAVKTVRGDFYESSDEKQEDNPDTIRDESAEGEVTPFQALTAALSATVGLGNIAGVAVALSIGGPGATFWLIVAGLLGMASKFVECTLGVKYREIAPDGTVHGGPMYYLKKGLAEKKLSLLGKIFAIFFAIMCVGGSFGGGNMFQSNQAFSMLETINQTAVTAENLNDKLIGRKVVYGLKSIEDGKEKVTRQTAKIKSIADKEVVLAYTSEKTRTITKEDCFENVKISPMTGYGGLVGLIMAILVAIVIIGGIKRIGQVTEKVVPFMAILYVGAALIIIIMNIGAIPTAFGLIFAGAFTPTAAVGGFLGVLIQGFKRAAFSNEAGVGSAAIAHSAVRTSHPASEGMVALLEPFIDTVVICTMTALVLIITNVEGGFMIYGNEVPDGVAVTSMAFESSIPGASYVLTIAVVLFAFSTMLSWSYYGLQAWKFLFGKGNVADLVYKILFCLFVIIGAAASLGSVIGFSDAMIFAMVFPNIIGLLILAPVVKEEVKKYVAFTNAQKAA